ncbi:MAG: class I SAM-dependent methyltransferase [Bacilli bacterium]|nr:class I SAM-dependent methyltransferase [Bacilli bacterium]
MTLSKRLETICSFIDEGAVIADIGSDHASVPLRLLELGKINRGEAVENKPGPYNRMKAALEESPYGEAIKPVFADGISSLGEEVDTLILAGMGSNLIVSILDSHKDKLDNVQTIITDAHTDMGWCRRGIVALGFIIIDEEMVEENGIFYNIMKWKRIREETIYSEEEIELGPINILKQSETWQNWLKKNQKKYRTILLYSKLRESREREIKNRLEMYEKYIKN